MATKHRLALCELHYTPIHGKTKESCPEIEGHYLLIATFKPSELNIENCFNEEYTGSDSDSDSDPESDTHFAEQTHLRSMMKMYRHQYANMTDRPVLVRKYPHKNIRNYEAIVAKKNYIQPEIVECIVLLTGETITIKKTCWLRIVQRTWKRIFRLRQKIALNINFIVNYQMQGNYSNKIPSIRGMLYSLRK